MTKEYTPINVKPQNAEDFELEIEIIDGNEDSEDQDSDDGDSGDSTSTTQQKPVQGTEDPKLAGDKPNTLELGSRKPGRAEKRIKELNNKVKTYASENEMLRQKVREIEEKAKSESVQSKEMSKTSLENEINSLNQEFISAMEAGDATKTATIQDKLMTAKMKLASVTYELQNTKAVQSKPSVNNEEEFEEEREPVKQSKPNEKALSWVEDHPEFYEDPVFYASAMAINSLLIQEGYDPNEDSFYEALDEKLSVRFPEVFGIVKQNSVELDTNTKKSSRETEKPAEKVQQTVSGASRTSSTTVNGKPQKTSSFKVQLTPEDLKLAERWGMSPERFAKRKLNLQKKEKGEYTPILV